MNTTVDKDATWLAHYRRGRDIVYFAEVFMGVKLNPAQQRWFRLLAQKDDGWSWRYRRVVHVAANQIGKTLGLAIAILWASTYKIGVKHDDWDTWLHTPYNWFHLAPTYTQSLHVMRDMKALCEGTHPAQHDRETGKRRKVYWQQGMWRETKFDGTYPGIELINGAKIHFRTSDEKAKSLQGVRAHGISMDEAAFENYLKEILDQAVKLRLISTGGPLWLVSTPNGITDYSDVVNDIINAGSRTFHERVWEAPDRKIALVWSHISDNVGYGLTEEDVQFMEDDVDKDTKEQQLRGAFLEPKDAYFTPWRSIAGGFTRKLMDEQEPMNDHAYVIFWDISVSNDPTVVVVLDVTRKPWKGVYFRRWAKPLGARELWSEMRRLHWLYSSRDKTNFGQAPRAITGFDSSGMGGVIFREELEDVRPQRPVNMTGSSKVKDDMLGTMKAAFSRRDLYVPASWLELKREMANYRRDDKHITQDSVIAMAGAIKLAAEGFSGKPRAQFSTQHTTTVRNSAWT